MKIKNINGICRLDFERKMAGKVELRRSIVLACVSGLCWLAQGFGQANLGNSTTLPAFIKHFPMLDSAAEGITDSQKSQRSLLSGFVVAVYELGLSGGGLSTYFVGDWLGRRNTAYAAAVIVIIGTLLQSASYSLGQLIVGRIVAGWGIGAFTATVPAWMTETAIASHRGPIVLSGNGFAITGVASMSWICLGMYRNQFDTEFAWRFPLALQGILAIVVIGAISFLSDSPRSLVRRNKRDKAYNVLKRNRHGESEEEVQKEFEEIILAYENELKTKDKSPWSFNEHKQFRRTVTAIILSGLCQWAGINLITFYGAIIFEDDIGLSVIRSRVALAGLQTWQAIGGISSVFFVIKFGRRNLVLICSAVMCICFCCCAGLDSDDSVDTKYGILAFDAIQLAAFPIGLLVNPFLIGSEIAGLLCRSAVMAGVASINWLMNFVLALVTKLAFQEIGYKYYTVFVATNATLFLFAFFFVPETGKLTLEEVDQGYVNSKHPFDIVKCMKAIEAAEHVPPEPLQRSESKKGTESVEMIEDVEKGI